MAGGAYQFRGNYTDSLPTAAALRDLGFQTFIVDYRLSPYTQEEGALDVARAVRFIRKNASVYGINSDAIAVMGFSAGGIQAGEFLMHYDEDVTGTALDSRYVPDELDAIPAHASAAGMIYSKEKERIDMIPADLFQFAYIPSWYEQLYELSQLAAPEPWRFRQPTYET